MNPSFRGHPTDRRDNVFSLSLAAQIVSATAHSLKGHDPSARAGYFAESKLENIKSLTQFDSLARSIAPQNQFRKRAERPA